MLRTSAVLENSQTPNREPIQVESSNSSFLEGQHLPQDVRCKPTTVPLLRWARHTRCSAFPRKRQQYKDIEKKCTCGYQSQTWRVETATAMHLCHRRCLNWCDGGNVERRWVELGTRTKVGHACYSCSWTCGSACWTGGLLTE